MDDNFLSFRQLLDENVLFHGSNKAFKTFDNPSKTTLRGTGVFLSNSIKYARQFGQYVYVVEIALKNPKTYETSVDFEVDVMKNNTANALLRNLMKQGHDGVIINKSKVNTGVVKEVICFEPTSAVIKGTI
jgi:hypothetical protein